MARTPAVQPAPAPRVDILDRSRHFATVSPVENGAAFKQNNRYYDNQGERVRMPGEPAEAPRKVAKTALAEEQPSAVEMEVAAAVEPADGDVVVGEVNLSAYAAGTTKYRFALVRDVILDRYAKNVVDEQQALEFLKEQGLTVNPALISDAT